MKVYHPRVSWLVLPEVKARFSWETLMVVGRGMGLSDVVPIGGPDGGSLVDLVQVLNPLVDPIRKPDCIQSLETTDL